METKWKGSGESWKILVQINSSALLMEKIVIGDHTFIALHTPGHAKHHIAWQLDDIIFTGDVAGVKIGKGPVVPPCPPPDINLEDWMASLAILEERNASKFYLTHFDAITNTKEHLAELRLILEDWSQWVKKEWKAGKTADKITPEFSKYTANQLQALGVDEMGVKQYEAANPSWMSVAGLIRYWKKKEQ